MAIIQLDKVAKLVAPATKVTRAIPLPMVADRCGPTVICPPDPVAVKIFNRLGTAIEAASANQFIAFSAATATMAPLLHLRRRDGGLADAPRRPGG